MEIAKREYKDQVYDDVLNRSPEVMEPHGHRHEHSRQHVRNRRSEYTINSGTRPSSWINDLFSWVKSSVSGLLSSRPALPRETSSTPNPISQVDVQMDVNGTIILLDLLVRKVTGQKYISSNKRGITEQEALGYVLSVTEKFRKVVEQAALKSGISIHRLNIDFMKMQEEITGKIMSDKINEISGVLKSHVEKALPGREPGDPERLSKKNFDKFITEFNSRIDPVIDQSIQQILSRDSMLKASNVKEQQISLKPRSYLNNTSVQGHLTQDRDLKKQGKVLIP